MHIFHERLSSTMKSINVFFITLKIVKFNWKYEHLNDSHLYFKYMIFNLDSLCFVPFHSLISPECQGFFLEWEKLLLDIIHPCLMFIKFFKPMITSWFSFFCCFWSLILGQIFFPLNKEKWSFQRWIFDFKSILLPLWTTFILHKQLEHM